MKPASIVRAVFLLLCLAWASPGPAGAQTTTGRLQGYVRGPDGEDIAGATVTARNTETNQSRQVVTSESGPADRSATRASCWRPIVRGATPITTKDTTSITPTVVSTLGTSASS